LIGLQLHPARRKANSETNCSAEKGLILTTADGRRKSREGERDQKSQEPAHLVGRRTGVAECVTPDRGRVESLPTCITLPTL